MTAGVSGWDNLSERERLYLIATIFGEARGESPEGMRAVAWVIRNRTYANEWGNTIEDVVTHTNANGNHEFSPWRNGEEALLARVQRFRQSDPDTYARIVEAARQTYNSSNTADPTHGALYFETTQINRTHDTWMERRTRGDEPRLTESGTIGNHVFYRDNLKLDPIAFGVSRQVAAPVNISGGITPRTTPVQTTTPFRPIINFNTPAEDTDNTPAWARAAGIDLSWARMPSLTRTQPPVGWHPPMALPEQTAPRFQVVTSDEQAIVNAFNQTGNVEVNLRHDVETNAAVRALQEALGVRADGIVGRRTRAAFDSSRFDANGDDQLSLGELRAALASIRQPNSTQR